MCRLRALYKDGAIKECMYFLLVIGALNLMRWMLCAANCLASERPHLQGIVDQRFRGKRLFQ